MAGDRAHSLSEERRDGAALLWLDVPNRPYNVLDSQVLAELNAAFDRLAADPSLHLLVLASRKETGFLAGADLHEFTTVGGAADAAARSAAGQQLFDKLAELRMPTVAVIHGVCLGGGLELALACDYRVAVDQPGTTIGLPEIKLGLLPGWGGTQRLPRVIGIERAIQVILQSRQLNAAEALRWGLVDAAVATRDEAVKQATGSLGVGARQEGKRPKGTPRRRTWRQRLLEGTAPGRWLLFREAERVVQRKVPDDMPGPLEALQAIRIGISRGMPAGLAYEREAIGRLSTTTACRNLVTLFFLIENARKRSEAPSSDGVPAIRRVGVVGAGTMGAGIAQLAAIKGFDVVIQEVNEAALAAGVRKVEDLFMKAAERGVFPAEEARKKLAAIGKTTTWEDFESLDLVVEAVVEAMALKKEVFRELERRCRPQAILATNTSSLSVQELQEGLSRPGRVGGLHFFNPVHKMPLVEVVQAPATEPSVCGALARWAADLGKTPVLVKDSPGFVVNRILMPYLNEAVLLVAEGMPVERLDGVMRRFGMPMGPFELMDQVGLDVGAHIGRTMQPFVGDRFPPNPTFERMAAKGWLGQKSGVGFYRYHGKKKQVNAELRAAGVFPEAKCPGQAEAGDARDRMVLLMVNEAAACLGEGLAASAEVIDLAMVLGTGWAPHRGGPLRYAEDCGVVAVVKDLEGLTRRLGPRFEPCAELRRRAAGDEKWHTLSASTLTAGR